MHGGILRAHTSLRILPPKAVRIAAKLKAEAERIAAAKAKATRIDVAKAKAECIAEHITENSSSLDEWK